MNYSKSQARDTGGIVLTSDPVPFKALQQFGAGAGLSSVITFNDNATNLEVTALGTPGNSGIAIRWIPRTETAAVSPFASVIASAAGANYDHIVANGQTRTFVIPREVSPINSIVGANIQQGLYQRVAFVQANIAASVYATTY